jgi:hypothetical protein
LNFGISYVILRSHTIKVENMLNTNSLISNEELDARGVWVSKVIKRCMSGAAGRICFFGRYAQWNGLFGSGVASLAGKLGRAATLFIDASEPIEILADRSVLVASFIFDAARDEFDDHNTTQRDTHRCLAQATVRGLIEIDGEVSNEFANPKSINQMFPDAEWITTQMKSVSIGYGVKAPDDIENIFYSMGYHLGSEILADQEFSVIDKTLREDFPEIAAKMLAKEVVIGPQKHNAYAWISIHSGYGGGAEADHFEWASRGGGRLALELLPSDHQRALGLKALQDGFKHFARDHEHFFTMVEAEVESLC